MSLGTGTKLGPYEIVELIGAGGMGEVYRATDTRLGRDVAVKVSAVDFGARFEREARAVASLNHPHICTLHDVGPNYLVMELIAGDTLAERLRSSPIPIPEALRIAVQIAEALEAAHEKGIVHRDLKPGNIKVKPDGTVKVLDFGLAKDVTAGAADGTRALANSPTFAGSPTEAGVILGTAAYMSPEQARGKAVDKRADIWAFGCVLFEMLTGKQAFEGDTLTDVLAALMKSEPEWPALPQGTPTLVRSVLRRCLQKDAARRLHDIADARIEIQEALSAPEPPVAPPLAPARRPGWIAAAPWLLAAVFAATAAWLATVRTRPDASAAQPMHVELNLPRGVESYVGSSPASLAFSPDGTRVAFVGILEGQRQVYLRRLDQFDAVPIKDTDLAASLFFSPDGKSIGVILTSRVLKTLSLDDGLSATLTRDVDYTAGGTWGPDNRITFGRNQVLWQVSASGGEPTQVTTLDTAKGELQHSQPALTTDGKALLFRVTTGGARVSHIEALPLSSPGAPRQMVLESGSSPIPMVGGHLLFLRSGAMLVAPFDAERLRAQGAPVRVADEVRVSTLGSSMMAAVSQTGSLAFMNGAIGSQLVWVSRQGLEQRITDADRPYASPTVSPTNPRRIAASWNGDVWIQDGDRAMRLTSDATAGNSYPVWTPDGKRVIFRTTTGMHVVDAEGSGRLQSLPGSTIDDYPNSVSPDGESLVFLRIAGDTGGDIYVTSLKGDSKPRPLVLTPAYEGGAQFSPDGKWIAFASNEAGHYQVFVRPFNGANRKWLASQSGRYPRWSANGTELYCRDGNRMLAVDVSMAGGEPQFSAPKVLFEQRYQFGSAQVSANYDVDANGQRFVMIKDDPAANRLNVILNWRAELERIAPGDTRR